MGAVMPRRQDIIQYAKWNTRLLRLLWGMLLMLTLCELAIFLLYAVLGVDEIRMTQMEFLLTYTIRPVAVYFVITLLTQFLFKRIFSSKPLHLQAGFILFSLVLLFSAVVGIHCGITVIYALYIAPILVSVVYADRRILLFAFFLSLLGYFATVFGYIIPFVPEVDYTHSLMDIISQTAILIATWLIARLVVERINEIVETARRIDNKRNSLSNELKRDSFTQLYNHATFYDALDHEILRHHRTGRPFSLILMDLDDFKGINDTFGHDVGDAVIMRFVDVLNACRGKQPAFRYGGEEFIVIARYGEQDAFALAERIRREFRRSRLPMLKGRIITVSIGICEYDRSFGGRREYFSAVDKALYAAKANGKDCTIAHREDMQESAPAPAVQSPSSEARRSP